MHPEEILNILTEMKSTAEGYLGESVQDAVELQCPPRLNDSQPVLSRQDAARIAGLNPLRIINEPSWLLH